MAVTTPPSLIIITRRLQFWANHESQTLGAMGGWCGMWPTEIREEGHTLAALVTRDGASGAQVTIRLIRGGRAARHKWMGPSVAVIGRGDDTSTGALTATLSFQLKPWPPKGLSVSQLTSPRSARPLGEQRSRLFLLLLYFLF